MDPTVSGGGIEGLGGGGDLAEVMREDGGGVALGEAESEAASLFEGVVEGVGVEGPEEAVGEEGVGDGMVRREGEGVVRAGTGESETRRRRRWRIVIVIR